MADDGRAFALREEDRVELVSALKKMLRITDRLDAQLSTMASIAAQTRTQSLHRLESNTKRSVASSPSVISSTSPPPVLPVAPIVSYRHFHQPGISSTVCSVPPPVPQIIVPAFPSSSTSSPHTASTFANSPLISNSPSVVVSSTEVLRTSITEPSPPLTRIENPHPHASPDFRFEKPPTKFFTQNGLNVEALWASQNVHDDSLRTATDPSKASVPVPDPTLHGLNDSDLTALVVDHTSDAVSHNKAKYGREFVAAATELMPESGVNRQLIELLSVRAPPAEKKLQLLKKIAEARGLDWDPAASETELFKPHEDLLNGPGQFVGGSQVPLPKEKHDEVVHSAIVEGPVEESDSDVGLDPLEFPEVPKVLLRPSADAKSAPEIGACLPSAPHPEVVHESITYSGNNENSPCQPSIGPEDMAHEHDGKRESLRTQVSAEENKQSVPFITLPSLASASFSPRDRSPSPSLSMTRSEASVDLQDVWAAAQAAAESAERAAAAARSAASLAEFAVSFDLRAVLDTVLSFSGKSHEKGIELAVYVSRQVPEIAIGDPGRFHQTITNLVGNSIKFTKDKGRIFVSVHQADEISNPPYMMDEVLRHCLNSSQTYPNALSGFLAVDGWKSWANYTQETHTRLLRMHQNFSSYNLEDKFVLNKWSIDKCRRQWDPGKYCVALDPDTLEFYLCV